ncbi:MAG: chaperone modulator CbpM [Burkholderiales bacterium]|nr:chaperone modulator CbpM [Burkholderiales bacterium]MDP2399458.1 chaperone modulator CbpM [Burkholderiales bacterium]MDP3716066.1 chaperone modulator CbpM [Burkholderiales bacterium]
MPPEHAEAVWLTGDSVFSLAELAEISGLPESELRELIDYGAVTPIDPESSPWMFNGKCLLTVRTACRLRISFDLEPHSVALMISLLEQIQDLEGQVRDLRARQPEQR